MTLETIAQFAGELALVLLLVCGFKKLLRTRPGAMHGPFERRFGSDVSRRYGA